MRVLALNAGSSSLKASVVGGGRALARSAVGWGTDASRIEDRGPGIGAVLSDLAGQGIDPASIGAVGHRVVHGGPTLVASTRIDDAVLATIDGLSELAPLHNVVAMETIRAARVTLPDLPHVACFDTAFHARLPGSARRYPVPTCWGSDWGVRRYGFHGLSVAWATSRSAELLERREADLGLIVAHLGSGCSVTAVQGGRSVATSMGLTPLEGLMMGTRAGSIDPGILLYLLRTGRSSLDELAEALDHGSGLLAVSERTSDVRDLEAAADAGDARATLALEMFVERAAAGIAAAATALDRLDAVTFTGGIGEHAGRVRASIVGHLRVLGLAAVSDLESGEDRVLAVDRAAERRSPTPGTIGPVALRVEAREDLVIAREVEVLVPAD